LDSGGKEKKAGGTERFRRCLRGSEPSGRRRGKKEQPELPHGISLGTRAIGRKEGKMDVMAGMMDARKEKNRKEGRIPKEKEHGGGGYIKCRVKFIRGRKRDETNLTIKNGDREREKRSLSI